MKIRSISIRSFKSFADTGSIPLGEHFTVLVGQNSSGKSAFLQALGLDRLRDLRHKNPDRDPRDTLPPSRFNYEVTTTGPELKRVALAHGKVNLPTSKDLGERIVEIHFDATNTYSLRWENGNITSSGSPTHNLFQFKQANDQLTVQLRPNDDRTDFKRQSLLHQIADDPIPGFIWSLLTETTFSFDAERYHIGRTGMSGESRLKPDASNLPYMLFRLQRDVKRFEQFQSLVSEVLPSIKRVVVAPVGSEIEISVQSHGSMREDLLVPLDECGTGTAQVIAIIYVVLAFESAQIAIDEPNSFLFPGAMRRLLQVLQRFSQHQFILSTHAAEVISILRPEVLLLIKWDEETGGSIITASSAQDIDALRTALTDLGASVADIFGFDLVVFVEGPTEAAVFPLLLAQENKLAVNFVAMREASALTSDRPEAMFDIYSRGVQGSNLQPPVTRFSFDREGRSQKQIEDLERTSRGAAKFLPRLMLESHFLNSNALSALIRNLDNEISIASEMVDDWLVAHYAEYPVKGVKVTGMESCDAAKLIAAMVSTFTEGRFQYDKVRHGDWLTRWLLLNEPKHLEGLAGYVMGLTQALI